MLRTWGSPIEFTNVKYFYLSFFINLMDFLVNIIKMEIPISHDGEKIIGYIKIHDKYVSKLMKEMFLVISPSYLKKGNDKELIEYHTNVFFEELEE